MKKIQRNNLCVFEKIQRNKFREIAPSVSGWFRFPQAVGDGRGVMFRFSIYMRHCPSAENAQVHIKRVKSFLPPLGQVGILTGRISYSRIGAGEISPAGLVFSACQKKHAEKDVANLTDVVCNAKSYVSEYFLIWESHLCHNLTIGHKNM